MLVMPLPILLGPICRLSRLKAPPPVRARFSLLPPGPKSKKLSSGRLDQPAALLREFVNTAELVVVTVRVNPAFPNMGDRGRFEYSLPMGQ